jgi:hypothetical protein
MICSGVYLFRLISTSSNSRYSQILTVSPDHFHGPRSLNLTPDSTQFLIDLKVERTLRGIALPWGNFEMDDTVSVHVYGDAALTQLAGSIEDSPVFREVYPLEAVSFEDAEFWDGRATAEDRARFPSAWFDLFDVPVIGRYLLVRITATSPGDSGRRHLRLARFLAAGGYQPTINADLGASIEAVVETIRATALGGADYYDQREKRRMMTFSFGQVEQNEAMAQQFDAAFTLGRSRQVVVAWDPDDSALRGVSVRACGVISSALPV